MDPPKCINCNKTLQFDEGVWGFRKYCSTNCTTQFRMNNRTKEQKDYQNKCISLATKKLWTDPTHIDKMKKSSSKTFKKLWLDESFRSEVSKRSSDNLKYLWKNRRNELGSIKGYFESSKSGSIPFRSSYELKAYKILDSRTDVKNYEVESLEVSYTYKGKVRSYYPDILVNYINGNKEVVEVKPEYFTSSDKNIAKFLSCIDFCKSKGMKFTIWTDFNWPTS